MEMFYIFLALLCTIEYTHSIVISTTFGRILGFHINNTTNRSSLYYGSADVFLGIPYAQAPINNLRFQLPQVVNAWSDVWNATYYRPACPQPPTNPPLSMSEDCLYLNIFTPNATSPTNTYPVMLFIHGGSFISGSASEYGLKGIIRNLVSQSVIVVTIQYRIGLLGFFTTQSSSFPANRGLFDQRLALLWVRQEIGKFGGNSNRITLFGQSAGACSVSAHTLSPLSQHLFQQAIMQSGTILLCFEGTFGNSELSEKRALQLCNVSREQWSAANNSVILNRRLHTCLDNMSASRFVALESDNLLGWHIVRDGIFIPDSPMQLAQRRPQIPVIIGTVKDEWSYFELAKLKSGIVKLSDYNRKFVIGELQQITSFYSHNQQQQVVGIASSVYINSRLPTPPANSDHIAWLHVISDILTDAGFVSLSARDIGWYLQQSNRNVFVYDFVYPPTSIATIYNVSPWQPVYHSSDLYYLFMMESVWENNVNVTVNDIKVANTLGQLWTNFAIFGYNHNWPATSPNNYSYMELNVQSTIKSDYGKTARLIWNDVIPAVTTTTAV